MYLERNRLENGRYEYLVVCPGCNKQRWIRDLRTKKCRSCAKKDRAFTFCRVWATRCKYCNEPKMMKSKPKVEGVSTCDYCKGKYGGLKAMKKEVKNTKRKCSECTNMFEARAITAKTCSKTCSAERRRRLAYEKYLIEHPKKTKKQKTKTKQEYSSNAFEPTRLKLDVKPREKVIKIKKIVKQKKIIKTKKVDNVEKVIVKDIDLSGSVDKNGKIKYIRDRKEEKRKAELEKKRSIDDEKLSKDLIEKYLANGGKITKIK